MPRMSFISPDSQLKKQTDFVRALFEIQGVSMVLFEPYQVQIRWSGVFSPDEILPQIETVLCLHLAA